MYDALHFSIGGCRILLLVGHGCGKKVGVSAEMGGCVDHTYQRHPFEVTPFVLWGALKKAG